MDLVSIAYGIGATNEEPGFNSTKAAIYFTVSQVVYILTFGILIIAVGMVPFRITEGTHSYRLRIFLVVSMAIAAFWSLGTAILFGLQCYPLSVAWGVGRGTCIPSAVLSHAGIAFSVMDVATGICYALLPIWILHKSHMPTLKKAQAIVAFGFGGVVSIVTFVVRFRFVLEVAKVSTSAGLASPDLIGVTLEGTFYSVLEIGLGIFGTALIHPGLSLKKRNPSPLATAGGINTMLMHLDPIQRHRDSIHPHGARGSSAAGSENEILPSTQYSTDKLDEYGRYLRESYRSECPRE
ncbi:hypothetical protein F5X96DRAFT_671320 [Biscogniauxia mediterranea]|nr:hypothetical protein F5X96DRAFT_671320 [Biscogniauxia mediterranea]